MCALVNVFAELSAVILTRVALFYEEKKSFRKSAMLSQSFLRQIHDALQTSNCDSAWMGEKQLQLRCLTTRNVRYRLDEIICRGRQPKKASKGRTGPPTRFRRTKLDTLWLAKPCSSHACRLMVIARRCVRHPISSTASNSRL